MNDVKCINIDQECESCAEGGIRDVPAIGHSENPDYSGYSLCQECIDEYDSQIPVKRPEIIYWDTVSDPANPGWVLRTDDEDVQIEAPEGKWLEAAAAAANYLGWDEWNLGFEDDGACPITRLRPIE